MVLSSNFLIAQLEAMLRTLKLDHCTNYDEDENFLLPWLSTTVAFLWLYCMYMNKIKFEKGPEILEQNALMHVYWKTCFKINCIKQKGKSLIIQNIVYGNSMCNKFLHKKDSVTSLAKGLIKKISTGICNFYFQIGWLSAQ